MILTGTFIAEETAAGRIMLDPFDPQQVNPNSYNYRLGATIREYLPVTEEFADIEIPAEGHVLRPNTLYLGHTYEVIGSESYAMSLIGRSSIGRLGLFLQVSANLGHTTSSHRWTLELYAALPIRVYPEMVVGQVSFWVNDGEIVDHGKTYAHFNDPHATVPQALVAKEFL